MKNNTRNGTFLIVLYYLSVKLLAESPFCQKKSPGARNGKFEVKTGRDRVRIANQYLLAPHCSLRLHPD
jgi:hypothetical protein